MTETNDNLSCGDHSLLVSKTELKARGIAQEDADLGIIGAIENFLQKV